ncbi:MAG TPA: PRC-barrel domain-containing protein [Burkholderiaceae bacterium]|nr:PRC-barrel domain-containing protein [Burkholderiaceae bacterium]
MKMKTLATALTLSLPLAIGTAFAQTTTTPDGGNNRSADGGATTTNQAPAAPAAGAATGTGAATGATGTTAAPGTTPGVAGSADRATPPDTRAPATDASRRSAASTEAITGWSAKDDLIGKSVVNENDEKIGDIEDIVISSDGRTLYLLVGAGGFLGMGSKNVAVPFDEFERREDRILLSGYTKEQLKALPEVRTNR